MASLWMLISLRVYIILLIKMLYMKEPFSTQCSFTIFISTVVPMRCRLLTLPLNNILSIFVAQGYNAYYKYISIWTSSQKCFNSILLKCLSNKLCQAKIRLDKLVSLSVFVGIKKYIRNKEWNYRMIFRSI